MGKKLAIAGDPTRSNEVIELLEMMGGINWMKNLGNRVDRINYIHESKIISYDDISLELIGIYKIFTLEEFLEKYPFKVGDKVIDRADGCPGVVCEMKWDEDVSDMKYCVAFGNGIDFGWFANDSIEFCKENENLGETPVRDRDDILFDSIIWHLRNSINNGKQDISGGDCERYFRELVDKVRETNMNENEFGTAKEPLETKSNAVKLVDDKVKDDLNDNENKFPPFEPMFKMNDELEYMVPDGYEIIETSKDKVFIKPIKSKYPKTYRECFYTLYGHKNDAFKLDGVTDEEYDLFGNLIKLRRCRDAYWKIAGEEMELGKHWEPDWTNADKKKYCIYYSDNNIQKGVWTLHNSILAFPTEEMRDTFYGNFKDLIEQCKELL